MTRLCWGRLLWFRLGLCLRIQLRCQLLIVDLCPSSLTAPARLIVPNHLRCSTSLLNARHSGCRIVLECCEFSFLPSPLQGLSLFLLFPFNLTLLRCPFFPCSLAQSPHMNGNGLCERREHPTIQVVPTFQHRDKSSSTMLASNLHEFHGYPGVVLLVYTNHVVVHEIFLVGIEASGDEQQVWLEVIQNGKHMIPVCPSPLLRPTLSRHANIQYSRTGSLDFLRGLELECVPAARTNCTSIPSR
mmetsp:Transcript_11594/g.42398  ORF Transcript_11594/g.42398 Transcript_11594/m.42398 type:complete len:244 (+) Transcript_11594:142-873(+)